MKKILLILTIISIFSVLSCKKGIDDTNTGNSKNAFSAIAQKLILNEAPSDFTILVSSVLPIKSDNSCNISNTTTGIQASCKELVNCGTLKVNNFDIPLSPSNTYFLQSDSVTSYTEFVSKKVNSVLSSTSSQIPSFDVTDYSPSIIKASYSGLVNSKIDRNANLSISWTPDEQNLERDIILVIEGTGDENSNELYIQTVKDGMGACTISNTIWSQFSNETSVRVYLARGYNVIHEVNNKSIEHQFLNYCWTRFYFAN